MEKNNTAPRKKGLEMSSLRKLVVISCKTIITCMDISLLRAITLKAWRKMVTTTKNNHWFMKIYQWKSSRRSLQL
jgi:hypothetical protein